MYKFTPSWALDWEYRKNSLENEILGYSTDIICLQEVETRTFNEFWLPLMTSKGYRGHFYSKTRSKTMQDSESKRRSMDAPLSIEVKSLVYPISKILNMPVPG